MDDAVLNQSALIHVTVRWKFQRWACRDKCRIEDSSILACTAAQARAAERQPDAAGGAEAGAEAEAMGDNIAEAAGEPDDRAPVQVGNPERGRDGAQGPDGSPDQVRDEVPEPSRSHTEPGTARLQSWQQESFSWFDLLVSIVGMIIG